MRPWLKNSVNGYLPTIPILQLGKPGLCYGALLAFMMLLLCLPAHGQPLTEEGLKKYKTWARYGAIKRFYEAREYQYAWINNPSLQQEFRKVLARSDQLGLNEQDYQYAYVNSYLPKNAADSMETDLRFTDAAIHFFTEVKLGNKAPSFRYTGLNYNPDAGDIAAGLQQYIRVSNLTGFLVQLIPSSIEYAAVQGKLIFFQERLKDSSFREIKIISTRVNSTNKPLLTRLYQLGITDSVNTAITDKELVQKLKVAQAQFDVLADGVLRSTTLAVLNVPLSQRIHELKLALNYLRWLEQIKQGSSVLILNLPAAGFMVYSEGNMILDSKVIAGKKSTPSPTLTSTIAEVILYPYWMVPKKIATKELLPSIKRNIGFLEEGNYQVINQQGRVVDPYSINWHALSAGYFPYIIRQSTGCDNALGIVKFNFYNPFTVYLHDTPGKSLFSFNKRFFSHGCMRVEKPIELAHLLLGSNSIAIDTLTAKGCINHQSPVVVNVEKRLPVVIMYSTAWYTKNGEVRFYDDIYEKRY